MAGDECSALSGVLKVAAPLEVGWGGWHKSVKDLEGEWTGPQSSGEGRVMVEQGPRCGKYGHRSGSQGGSVGDSSPRHRCHGCHSRLSIPAGHSPDLPSPAHRHTLPVTCTVHGSGSPQDTERNGRRR